MNDGLWHLVGATLTWGPGGSSATGTLFVDGAAVATVSPVNLTGVAGGSFAIGSEGARTRGVPAGFFTGEIDEVEIFDRALTQADFVAIYNARRAGKCPFCGVPTPAPIACGTRGNPTVCPGNQFCDFFLACGATDTGGVCTPKPAICPPVTSPVCGCDGNTYDNACLAASQGASVNHGGSC